MSSLGLTRSRSILPAGAAVVVAAALFLVPMGTAHAELTTSVAGVDITVAKTADLHDGESFDVTATVPPPQADQPSVSLVRLAGVFCKAGVDVTDSFTFGGGFGTCTYGVPAIGLGRGLSDTSGGVTGNLTGSTSGRIFMIAGVGSVTIAGDGTTDTVACTPVQPCQLVLLVQTATGENYLSVPLTLAGGPAPASTATTAPGATTVPSPTTTTAGAGAGGTTTTVAAGASATTTTVPSGLASGASLGAGSSSGSSGSGSTSASSRSGSTLPATGSSSSLVAAAAALVLGGAALVGVSRRSEHR
jgi:LPXTG-motif cell wall-anchored protein